MLAVAHAPAPADHHIAHRIPVAGEDQRIEQQIALFADELRMIAIENQDIGAIAGCERTDPAAEGACAANERTLP